MHLLTSDRWDDFRQLFGAQGACGGCWCMWWRLTRSEFEQNKGQKNKEAMRDIVHTGEIPGILLYQGSKPIAWCSIAPRERYPGLGRSRVLGRVDDKPVWSIVCFYIIKECRKKGLLEYLINAAVMYAQDEGATIAEAYPVEPQKGKIADVFAWTGIASAFRKCGFKEVARRSPTRPIMRLPL
ncbi:MAG: hypothetical protein A2Y62_16465 [Candidatus Fischerbacteria bacterium RBG_13_37_8]|uniref:N-acetyltransferase domain-containing protein n=1 Tax=Candidatus Fischerbacteria bacterium RBG_13_37_8 TaxID=1817863 RepID=A0A1F5VJN5_9BACT|nr:MAG: hypothetical protein A2Y62_16465 [Candidatus Fischerbacteria bacterium RBG_13_37_8]